jgi:hypothetical protein
MRSPKQILCDERQKELLREDVENVKWLHENYRELLKKYRNMYVAVRKKRVIDGDYNVSKLIERLERKFKETEDILVYFISTKKFKLLV